MKKVLLLLIPFVMFSGIFLSSCKEEETTGPSTRLTRATISGTVKDSRSGSPLSGATVNLALLGKGIDETKTTSISGGFSFSVDLGDTQTASGTLTVTKSGYKDKVSTVTLIPGKTTVLPDIAVDRDTTTGIGGGRSGTTYANTIAFISAVPTQLSVRGVGGNETSIFTFEARDSFGVPIDFDHKDTITFTLSGVPRDGGAYVSPQRVITNASGRVAVTINSGTVSGSLQIVASLRRESDGRTIQSEPARIIIHGGLPDQRYFSIAANPSNVPGLTINGKPSVISIIVGDKYGNPVAEGTAVHFFTGIGVVTTDQGFTNANGFASATLYSGNPRTQTGQSPGFGYVKARTVGENGVTVMDSVRVLFSGPPDIIQEIGTHFDTISAGGCNTFTIRIADINGNPLSPGTTITPVVNSRSTTSIVPSSIRMPDTQARGAGSTEFVFQICDIIEEEAPVGGTVDVYISVAWEGLTVTIYIATFVIG